MYEDGKRKKQYCFLMILGYSRMRYIEFVTDMSTNTLIRCHQNAFGYFGGYPEEIVYDNMKQVVIKRLLKREDSTLNRQFEDFAGFYGFKLILCRPYRGQTKGKAERTWKETAVRLQLGRGLDVLAQRDSFSIWADDWLHLKEKEGITCRQMDNYRRAVKLWKESLEGYEIGQVRADDIERVLVSLVDQSLSQRTVNLYRATIRQVLRRAVGRVIPSNPVDLVKLSTAGRKEEQRRALTAEEQRWIWDTPHRAQPVAVIMMLSDLRRGELAALTWNDVDLRARTIAVNKSVAYDSNGVLTLQYIIPPQLVCFARPDQFLRKFSLN